MLGSQRAPLSKLSVGSDVRQAFVLGRRSRLTGNHRVAAVGSDRYYGQFPFSARNSSGSLFLWHRLRRLEGCGTRNELTDCRFDGCNRDRQRPDGPRHRYRHHRRSSEPSDVPSQARRAAVNEWFVVIQETRMDASRPAMSALEAALARRLKRGMPVCIWSTPLPRTPRRVSCAFWCGRWNGDLPRRKNLKSKTLQCAGLLTSHLVSAAGHVPWRKLRVGRSEETFAGSVE